MDYGADLSIRDRLIEAGAFYGDLGRAGIARLTRSHAAALAARGVSVTALAPVQRDEVLIATAGHGMRIGRVLLARSDLVLSAARRADLPEDLHSHGHGLHGGIQVLALDRPYARRAAGAPPSGPLVYDPRIAALVAKVQQANLLGDVTALSKLYTRHTRRPENAQAVAYVTTELRKLPNLTYKTERFSTSYGPNVIAELKGTDLANEVVMVGAHLDSIVRGGSSARAPGADDNASGSAAVLEIARIFAGQKFRRTVRFAWWNAEELGLIGSAAYAAAAKRRGDKIVAYVNCDMTAYRARGDALSVDYVTNDSTPGLISRLVKATQTYVPSLRTNVGSLFGGTSDHRSFFRNGFPAAFPFEDLGQYSPYIHTANDVVGTSANDFNLSRLITQSVVAGLAELAEISAGTPGKFELFGQGCRGGVRPPSLCASVNPNGGTLAGTRRTNEYAYQVPASGTLRISSFEIYTRSTSGSVRVTARLYADASGVPATTPLATTTMSIGPSPGFYRATLAVPVTISGTFFVALDHTAGNTVLSQLTSGSPGVGYWRRPAGSGAWSRSSLITRPSVRVVCSGGAAVPRIGHSGMPLIRASFDVTLGDARPNASVVLLTGASNTRWAGGTLPVPIPGAPGCNVLTSSEVALSATSNASGSARITIPIPDDPKLIGASVFHQWAVIDPAANTFGLAVSAGARTTVGG